MTDKTPAKPAKTAAKKATAAPAPDAPAAEVPFPSEQPPVVDVVATVAIQLPSDSTSRFPVMSEPEHIDAPVRPDGASSVPPTPTMADPKAYEDKIHTSRRERLRRGQ